MSKRKETGLVLQGGGALGAYQYGAIKAYEKLGFRAEMIEMVRSN